MDSAGLVLMVENPYRKGLVLPGGMIEAGESPGAAAEREVREETGLEVLVQRLLLVHHKGARPGKPAGLQFVFDTQAVPAGAVLTPQQGEVIALHWLEPHAAVQQHVAVGRHRLLMTLQAKASGHTYYLDDDRQIPTTPT